MRIRICALTAAVCAALSVPAYARTPSGEDAETPSSEAADGDAQNLDTIVVTSTKREELMRDVPVSISVVDREDIETAGLNDASDIAPMVPGFVMVPLFGSSGYNPVIRGLNTAIGEPNVGFFIDGVYIPSRAGLDFALGDNIQRVEVARGPQYALYGRNTFGGAVNFVTRLPGDQREGSVRAGLSSDGGREAGATLSGPLASDALFFRVGALARDSDGHYENELTGGELDWSRSRNAFLTLSAYPGERWDAQLNLMYERMRQGDVAQRFVPNNGGFVARFNDEQQFFGNVPTLTRGFEVTPGHFDRDNLMGALSLHYDFEGAKLTAIAAYDRFETDQLYDSDYTAREISQAGTRGTQTQWSQEFNLASQGERKLDWLIGAYYYDLRDDRTDQSRFVGAAAPLGGTLSDNAERTRSRAIFGQATWRATERLGIGLAMRYTEETKSADVAQTNLPSATNPAGSVQRVRLSERFEPFTPGIYVTYQANDMANYYASVVRAVKVGGFNTLITNGAIADDERSFDAETSMNYEIGGKFSLFDGKLFLDTSLYAIEWDDQIVRSIGRLGATLNVNAGKTSSRGVEVSFEARPTPEWTLRGGASYNRATYDDYVFPLVGAIGGDPDLSGKPLQYAPQRTANFSAMREHEAANGWTWFARGDALYRSSMVAVQTATARIPGAARLNLHAGARKNDVEVMVWIDNAFDDDGAASAVFLSSPATIYEFATRQRAGRQLFQPLVNAPDARRFGVNVRYRF
ncbi:MAG: TonB-dependent receptor [Lysobacter sp.]|nr:MAG: TonB-dependent receptor [Lysobacter sp.]